MGKKYLIDTNTLIDAQANNIPVNELKFLEGVIDEDFNISFITYIEFLDYKEATQVSVNFIKLAHMLSVNKSIIDACIALRKAKCIKLPDAIIAATALVYDMTLISRNISDFNAIPDLSVIDLYSL